MSKAIAKHTPAQVAPTDHQIAEQLTEQYNRAIAGTREVLGFGCMMIQLPSVLEFQNGGMAGSHDSKGMGLKGWIEEHCPDINYNTAYAFYRLAKSMREALGIKGGTDIHKLLTAPPASLSRAESKIRKQIDGAITGKSMRQLEFDFGIRKPSGKSGAPQGNQNASKTGKLKLTDAEAAKMQIGSEIGAALKMLHERVDNQTVALLGLDGLRILKADLDHLSSRLKPLIAELAKKPVE